MTVKIGYKDALRALEEAVKEKGEDYVYPQDDEAVSCTYTERDGTPSCIVGHVIAKLDPENFKIIAAHEWYLDVESETGLEYQTNLEASVSDINQYYPTAIQFTEKAEKLLGFAQSKQDRGTPWGVAVQEAVGIAGTSGASDA